MNARHEGTVGQADALTPVDSREAVLLAVVERPGTWAAEAAQRAGFAYATVFERLAQLAEEGHLEVLPRDRENHYYPRFTSWEKEMLAWARSEEAWKLLLRVAEYPGRENSSALTQALGLSVNSVRKYIDDFARIGVLTKVDIPSPRRPGVGALLNWMTTLTNLRSLLLKLPPGNPDAATLRALLKFAPTPPDVEDQP